MPGRHRRHRGTLRARWIDASDGAGNQDFRPEPPSLLECAAGKFVAGDPARKSEIILNSRRRSGLSTGRLTLDNDRAQSLGCAVDGRGKAGRPTADNGDIVFGSACAGLKAEAICEIAHFGPLDDRSVREPHHGTIVGRWTRSGPIRRQFRRIRRQPIERNLVARQKPTQVAASGIPAVTDQCHARLMRFGGDALEPSYSLARERADLLGDVLRHCRDRVILLNIDSHHARRFGGAISPWKRRAKGNRHLTKNGARDAPAEPAFDPVDRFDDLDLAGENSKERALSPFVDR